MPTATTVLKRLFIYKSLGGQSFVRESAVFATEMETKAATVLCIDDEQTALQLRQSVLQSAGYNVLTAKSGSRGMQVFQSEPVQAVVLDYWMADMNGMQVAREIRKINPKVPIIILSAYGELLDESLGVADLWIRKGEEDPQYLLSCLEDLLKSRPALPQRA